MIVNTKIIGGWKTSHSPKAEGGTNFLYDNQGYLIGEVFNHNQAKLMSAAPELLEALQTILNKEYYSILPSEWDKARAAIEKATKVA